VQKYTQFSPSLVSNIKINLGKMGFLISFNFFSGFNDIAGLSTMDYVTLAVIENYLEFKVIRRLIEPLSE
jgi:hypothetical protein